jgi:hypothetical protein
MAKIKFVWSNNCFNHKSPKPQHIELLMILWFLMLFVPSKHKISFLENIGLITLIKPFLGFLLACWEFLKGYPLVFIQLNQLINFGLNYFLVGGEGPQYFIYWDLQMNRQSDIHPINQFKRVLFRGLIFGDYIIPKCKLALIVPTSLLFMTIFLMIFKRFLWLDYANPLPWG